MSSQQNIVSFFSDQQKADTLSCHGQMPDVTPRLDAFAAKDAMDFVHAYTAQPMCGPARAMLQTGLYPTQTGCFRNVVPLPLNQKTLARRLREAGYQVAYMGKWHLASDKNENHYKTIPIPPERRGGYDDYWMAADVLEFTSHGHGGYIYDKDGKKLTFIDYRSDCLVDYGVCYIEEYQGDKSSFLMVFHIESHHQNDRNDYEGPEGSRERSGDFTASADLERGKGDWEKFYPDYLGCCHALGANSGRIIDALKKKGIYDSTMVIHGSDHGCHFRTHMDEVVEGGYDDYKRNSPKGTIHVSLMIKGNGFVGGTREEHVISLLDVPETILTAANCSEEPLKELQGRPSQETGDGNQEDAVYIQINESLVGRAVRTKRYKYVIHAPGRHPQDESSSDVYQEKYLFDLRNDPLEKINLIRNPDHDKIRRELRERTIRFGREARECFRVEAEDRAVSRNIGMDILAVLFIW